MYQMATKKREQWITFFYSLLLQFIQNLKGGAPDPKVLKGDFFDEGMFDGVELDFNASQVLPMYSYKV